MQASPSTPDRVASVDVARGQALLAIARSSIGSALGVHEGTLPDDAWLTAKGATFVTLMLDEDLRGCIGSVEARRALGEDVWSNARSAALDDPRFAPMRVDELARVKIEVSLLTPLERLAFASEDDAIAQLRPGRDGVVLRVGLRRSTLLPQVWEMVPERDRFVAALKRKLGVPGHYWGSDVELFRYEVQHFHEDGYPDRRVS